MARNKPKWRAWRLISVHLPVQFLLLGALFCPYCLNKVFKHHGCLIGGKIAIYYNKIT